jgi:poly(3-hydroxybutyrate) depolymerase
MKTGGPPFGEITITMLTLAPLLVCLLAQGDPGSPVPGGAGKFQVPVAGGEIEVFTYKPATYRDGPILVVCHGTLRNAEDYRDNARGLSERLGMLVIAPKFDRERFPNAKYHRGGLLDGQGKVTSSDEWTWSMIPRLVDATRRREGRPEVPFYVIGHSAGAQFAERMAAFAPDRARRIVVANAGVHLFPTRDLPFTYGFGGLPESIADDDALRRYVAQPVTIYLGTADILRDSDLSVGGEADQEGRNRFERGRNAFDAAEKLARQKGWPFGWRLVEAPGVGHDGRAMFDHPNCKEALLGP